MIKTYYYDIRDNEVFSNKESIEEYHNKFPGTRSHTILELVKKSEYDALIKERTAYRTLNAILGDVSEKIELENKLDASIEALKEISEWGSQDPTALALKEIAQRALEKAITPDDSEA